MVVDDFLSIRGARVHNLKNISVDIPHNQLTVVTGVSGSGKSSLVFDTVYAEGQRRYVESLSAYARQFLERMEKPDVDEILGIAPPIAIKQKNTTRNPRSTVATSTELYDFFRLLYARVGRTICPNCDTRVQRDTVDYIAGRMLQEPEGSRWFVLFPVRAMTDTQQLRDHLFELRRKGFTRLVQEGRTFEFSTPESLLDIDFSKPVFVLVDRIAIAPDLHQRLVDSTEICYREAGEVLFEHASDQRILQVLQLTVREAIAFFVDLPKLVARLKVLNDVGLGYLRLGQSATTLSGGEAQRVKLAGHLAQASCKGTLFIFDEPTTGLHFHDISSLLESFQRLITSGGSILVIEHNLDVIRSADWIVDLGPEGGGQGGRVIAQGTPEQVALIKDSYTGQFLSRTAV